MCFNEVKELIKQDGKEDKWKQIQRCETCEINSRCDMLEDKPLIDFTVKKSGMVKSDEGINGEWWIGDEVNDDNKIDELHFRALDHIWKEALDWANEIVLPL